MTPAQFTHELVLSAVDLTRKCTEHELYLTWLQLHTVSLHGSAGIAQYLFLAAVALEEQAHRQASHSFDPYIARETFADILMASVPLSCEELRAAASSAICEASDVDCAIEQRPAPSLVLPTAKGPGQQEARR